RDAGTPFRSRQRRRHDRIRYRRSCPRRTHADPPQPRGRKRLSADPAGSVGALIPFIGPYFDFAWGTNNVWVWTAPRGWLEVLPGVATAVGGLLLLASGNRATAMLGGWLTVLAGAWFVTGRSFASLLNIGDVGRPLAETAAKYAALDLAYFSGLGAVIVFLGALALGRLSVRSLRDIQYAQ